MNVFGIRTLADLRAFMHVLAPVVLTALTAWHIIDHNAAALWGALIFALISPALAAINSTGFRQAFYTVLIAAQAVVIGVFGIGSDATWTPLVSIIMALVGGGIAAANTPTSVGPGDPEA